MLADSLCHQMAELVGHLTHNYKIGGSKTGNGNVREKMAIKKLFKRNKTYQLQW